MQELERMEKYGPDRAVAKITSGIKILLFTGKALHNHLTYGLSRGVSLVEFPVR